MQGTVLQSSFHFGNLFGSAGSAGSTQLGDGNSISRVALGPVSIHVAAVHNGFKGVFIVLLPYIGSGGQRSGGSGFQHINVVAYGVADLAAVQQLLGSGRSTGGIGVLADDYGTVGDQRFSGGSFHAYVGPGVGVVHFHYYVGNDGAYAQEECGVAGDNFSEGECAYVTDLHIAVLVKGVGLGSGGQNAGFQQFLDLHTGNNTGYVTGFVNSGKCVLQVRQTGNAGEVTGHSQEGNFRELFGGLCHECLMTVGVGNHNGTAVGNQVGSSIQCGGVFSDLVLPDDLGVVQLQGLGSSLDAVDVCQRVTFGFVTDQNHPDLEIGVYPAAGEQSSHGAYHGNRHDQSGNLLEHLSCSSCFFVFCVSKIPPQGDL